MEWVQTTGKTVAEAEEQALDQLGVARDEAEFEIVEEPRSGLFGLIRGEARIRARVRPTAVRPKLDRRRSRKGSKDAATSDRASSGSQGSNGSKSSKGSEGGGRQRADRREDASSKGDSSNGSRQRQKKNRQRSGDAAAKEQKLEQQHESVDPQVVGEAAVEFMDGLVTAFGATGTSNLLIDGTELDVQVSGSDLGLLVGPGGRTLNAVQDLARVAAQRRLGDHETRLRIDIGGYREKRREALEEFTRKIVAQVSESGSAKALEPMSSADRKVVHDTVNEIDGVESHSDGDDPVRRVVITPS